MAHNSVPIHTEGSFAAGQEQVDSRLNEERTRVAKEIIAVIDESDRIWNVIAEKQFVIHRLYAEQIVVSDKFTQYNLTWRDHDYSISENIDTLHRFTEIDEQVQQLLRLLEEFEAKTDRSGGIVRDFNNDMNAHLGALQNSVDIAKAATCVEDLATVPIPNLEWIQRIPDPEIEVLADEWDHMRLDPQITHFHCQLQALVQSNGQTK